MNERHDFLRDDKWEDLPSADDVDEWDEDDSGGQPPQRGRRRRALRTVFAALVAAALVGVVILTVWGARDTGDAPAAAPSDESADVTPAPETEAATEEAEEERSAPLPDPEPVMSQTLKSWATRESPDDESWKDWTAGTIAPDLARRLDATQCLPLDYAPLRVDGMSWENPDQSGVDDDSENGRFERVAVIAVGAEGGTSEVTVRVQALWDEAAQQWTLTQLDCVGGGDE